MKRLTDFLDKYLSPLGTKLGNQRHLKALSNGMMMTLPLLVIGSIFMMLNNPPINIQTVDMETSNVFIRFLINWKQWAMANSESLLAPYHMTFGMLGLMTSFSVSYCLAKSYKMDAAVSGIMTMSVFLLVCSSVVQVPVGDNGTISAITSQYLSSDGLFVALILSFACVEITRMVDKLGIKVKFPSSVPSMVTTFVNSLLPLFINIIVIYGINLMLISTLGKSFPEAIMSLLTPAIDVGNNIWVYAGIIMFSNVLWFLGINGTSVIFSIVFMIGLAGTGANAEMVARGLEPTNPMNLQLFRYAMLGGAGGTLGLVVLMWKSKSAKLKSLARISVVPGICSINEPITFGVPIAYNPLMAIPYILTPSICVVLGYYAQVWGFITPGYIADPSFIPFFIQGWMSGMDIRNVIFMFLCIGLSLVTFYPFFKAYEKVAIQQEVEEAKEEEEFEW
ncbi:PTS sugar transporter subunit IIC [Peribacillus loiseleuriae]|uniref:Permease IIC component n=1 Tax=Peribacillus loiseleuriae TaxID=1679170 RepID=A0A0K9GT80_9BACI|nr:PTS transporter subunit EIIC [Peribacillus loiseleuriae]KMY49850.1 PTS sugar transporter subunit IIBC [Peribacillus loiseleuriae]